MSALFPALPPPLSLFSLTKRFGATQALDDVELTVARGEVVALMGANGAGKSTLAKIASGVIKPDSGRIVVSGRELSLSSPQAARIAGIVVVHQSTDQLGVPGFHDIARQVLDEALEENGNKFDAGYVFVAGFRPLELRGEIWAEVKKANPGIEEKAVWGAVDSNTATTVASQTAAVLRAHPEITVVFAPYDEFARGVKLGAVEAGVASKIKVYSADVSTSDIQEIREQGSPWIATSATNPAVVGEVSLGALALLIAGQDPGKIIEVKPLLITREELDKNDIKTVQDLDKKLPGFGQSDQATAAWLAAPVGTQ